MGQKRIQILAEISISVALAAILHFVALFHMPQGGTVNLEMLPIILVALRRGFWPGIVAGLVYSPVLYLVEPFYVHPAQLILDYPLAFGLLGLAGLFRSTNIWSMSAGVLAGCFGRFMSHFFSGAIFFASYAPKGQSPWLYSLVYNGSYMLPSTILCLTLALLITKSIEKTTRRF